MEIIISQFFKGKILPDGTSRKDESFVIQTAHQDVNTFINFTQNIFFGNFAVFENQFASVRSSHAQLVQFLSSRETLETLFDQESSDTLLVSRRISLGINNLSRIC